MNNIEKLNQFFKSGKLLKPDNKKPNFIDLTRSLAIEQMEQQINGLDLTPEAINISKLIGKAEHYLFILIDGVGISLLEKILSPESFLRSHLCMKLQAIFPSTTACALTSLATGRWPCEHGVVGWWTYLQEKDLSILTLPFVERFNNQPAENFGVKSEDVFPVKSVWRWSKRKLRTFVPMNYFESTYNRYAQGAALRNGYSNLDDALALIVSCLKNEKEPSFSYFYFPEIDALCHHYGTGSEQVKKALLDIDSKLSDLRKKIDPAIRIIITADHGHIDVPKERRIFIPKDHEIFNDLLCCPTGEPVVPVFHVKPECEKDFQEKFDKYFGNLFCLFDISQVEQLKLFGPGPLSPVTRKRLGSFVGITDGAAYILLEGSPPQQSVHAGLTKNEMEIGLILA